VCRTYSYRDDRCFMPQAEPAMNQAEADILRFFRTYGVKSNEMLFFNCGMAKSHPPQFKRAMQSMMQRGLVVQERHRNAYSLTASGYRASLSA
jgi:hypothetical protein